MEKFFYTILLIPCLLFPSCGSSNRQDDANRVVRAFALTARTFVDFFENDLGSCSEFIGIFDQLSTNIQACDNSTGTFQLIKETSSCLDGAPIIAEAKFSLDQKNCQDNDTNITTTGLLALRLSFSSEGNLVFLGGTDLIINDFLFTSSDFEVRVDLSNNNLTCDGDLIQKDSEKVDQCSASSDCRECN